MVVFLSWDIEYRSREVMLQLSEALNRPQLEYCVRFCSPRYRKDVIALKRVERRFTRILFVMEQFIY